MKKILRLKESDIKYVIKRVLSEMPMGVPDNITETAEQIYSAAISKFSSKYGLGWDDKDMKYEVTIDGNFTVSDYKFNSVYIKIDLSEYKDDYSHSPPKIIGAAVGNQAKVIGNKTVEDVGDSLNVLFNFAVGQDWNLGMLLDLMKSERSTILSMLSHELFHQFEHYKKSTRDARQRATYTAAQKLNIERVQPLNHFLHLLYFTHETERYTRPSEFYGELKANKITKEKFKEFFKESRVIKPLIECRDYTFTKLINDLRENMSDVNHFLSILKEKGAEVDLSAPDSVKIGDTLKYFHIILNNATLEEYSNILRIGLNPFTALFLSASGIPNPEAEQAQSHLDDFVKEIKRFKNYQEFFDYWIKKINFVGETTIKKLSKLYDMVDNDKNSIVNWDLHHKINKTAEKTKKRLHELLRDKDPKITDKPPSD